MNTDAELHALERELVEQAGIRPAPPDRFEAGLAIVLAAVHRIRGVASPALLRAQLIEIRRGAMKLETAALAWEDEPKP